MVDGPLPAPPHLSADAGRPLPPRPTAEGMGVAGARDRGRGGDVTIDAYLAELRRRLRHRPFARRRILEEVEAHLRESAEAVGEDEAVRRFGEARVVAAGYPPP